MTYTLNQLTQRGKRIRTIKVFDDFAPAMQNLRQLNENEEKTAQRVREHGREYHRATYAVEYDTPPATVEPYKR